MLNKSKKTGIYLHIPFCSQACTYCDFHFSTSFKLKNEIVRSMIKEINWAAKNYPFNSLETIYFGGGTPSVLAIEDLVLIFEALEKNFDGKALKEITFEANPEDLTMEKLQQLKRYTPINRFSIGIQSFFDADLGWMNRAHSGNEAHQALDNVFETGFDKVSIDLIYGSPTTTHENWLKNLEWVNHYNLSHLSAYCLTVEPKTSLHHQIKKGTFHAPQESHQIEQFDLLMDWAEQSDLEQYEISNFCTPGNEAVHNGNYWQHKPYIGIGPSAHSFDGQNRFWNVSNNAKYIESWKTDTPTFQQERLSVADFFNEFIMVRLRTAKGLDLEEVQTRFPNFIDHLAREAKPFIKNGQLEDFFGTYRLTRSGKKIADQVSSSLFWV